VTTCPIAGVTYSTTTNFNAYLRLYNTCPTFSGDSAVLLAENDPAFFCAYMTYTILEKGTYWYMAAECRNIYECAFYWCSESALACLDF
jgi:hypothetical protein